VLKGWTDKVKAHEVVRSSTCADGKREKYTMWIIFQYLSGQYEENLTKLHHSCVSSGEIYTACT
jgi:hypothetical protein